MTSPGCSAYFVVQDTRYDCPIIGAMAGALMVTSSFLPGRGGIESYLAQLCAELSPALAVLAPHRRDGQAIPADLGYPTLGYPGRMLLPSSRVVRAIVRAASDHDTDRILFGTPWPLALLAPRLTAAGLRYSVIVHGAELLVPAAIPGLRARLARALAGADLLLPVSRFTASKLAELLDRENLAVPTTDVLRARIDLNRWRADVDLEGVRRRYGLEPKDRVVLIFGRLIERKGAHRLIDALPEISRRVPGAVAVIAGTGPQERALRRRASRAEGRVVFTGRVPEADSPSLYAAADVFALPVANRYFGLETEGLGVVLLEASACETPCVTGRSGGTTEAVVDGVTGYVVDALNRDELVDRIVRLLADHDSARTMGRAARVYIRREFTDRLPDSLLHWIGLRSAYDS